MNSFHPALVAMLAASLIAASPAFGQSAETPFVNGHAVTTANPLPVVQTQPPPGGAARRPVFAMPASPQLSRWRLDCQCFKANP